MIDRARGTYHTLHIVPTEFRFECQAVVSTSLQNAPKLAWWHMPKLQCQGHYFGAVFMRELTNLHKAGWSLGRVSALDVEGRTIWIADVLGF